MTDGRGAEEPRNRDFKELRAELEKRAKAMQEQEESTAKLKYSPEVIQRYREMQEKHAFGCQVKQRVPVDLNADEATLSCGHKLETMASLIKAMDGQLHCRECQNEWLAKAVEEEKRNQDGSDK